MFRSSIVRESTIALTYKNDVLMLWIGHVRPGESVFGQ